MKQNLNRKLDCAIRQILPLCYVIVVVVIILFLSVFANSTIHTIPVFADVINYNINVKPTLSLSLSSSSISLNLNPANNAFGTRDLDVVVGTNNLNGYKLYISSDGTGLVNTTSSSTVIETLPSSGEHNCSNNNGTNGCSELAFPINYWGYKLNTDNFVPFVSNTLVSSAIEPVNNNATTITFGAKIDYNKPAGIYERTFDFKALPIVTQTYMQNMDPSVCTTDPTMVIDARDEHPYIVQRLADGKCWMLDNLDLDLTDRNVVDNLTVANTNIDTVNDPNALDYLKNGGGTALDKYAIKGLSNSMHAYSNWTNGYSYSEPLANRSGKCIGSCEGVWQNADYAHNTVLDKVGADNVVIKDNANNIGGPGSYQIGTHYNYCAASAGTYCYGDGTTMGSSSGNATSDICPAGWHMPSMYGDKGDYIVLCSAVKGIACANRWNTMDITDAASMQYQLSLPLSGRYNGYDSPGAPSANYYGMYGLFWTSTNNGVNSGMRNLIVRSSGIHLNDSIEFNRVYGYAIRCLSS